MTDSLRHRCELLTGNRDILRKEFKSGFLVPLCASLYSMENAIIDTEKIRFCREMIKQKTSMFSGMRSMVMTALAVMLSLEADSERALDKTLEYYRALRKCFLSSPYISLTAFSLAKYTCLSPENTAERVRQVYDIQKKAHPVITSEEDICYAALFVAGKCSDRQIEDNTEICFSMLKGILPLNTVQTVANVISLGGMAIRRKCERFIHLYETLKSCGCNFGRYTELASLAVLALLDVPDEEIINSVSETNEYLKDKPGFGFFMGRKQRLMYSAIQVSGEYIVDDLNIVDTTQLCTVTAMMLASQAAISATIAACVAASASASSS